MLKMDAFIPTFFIFSLWVLHSLMICSQRYGDKLSGFYLWLFVSFIEGFSNLLSLQQTFNYMLYGICYIFYGICLLTPVCKITHLNTHFSKPVEDKASMNWLHFLSTMLKKKNISLLYKVSYQLYCCYWVCVTLVSGIARLTVSLGRWGTNTVPLGEPNYG